MYASAQRLRARSKLQDASGHVEWRSLARCSRARTRKRHSDLIAAGRMAAPGLAAIARAKADGSWTALDDATALETPDDLVAALAMFDAAEKFAEFPPSLRRAILEWIATAKRPETRAKRIAETARFAIIGLRANFAEAKAR